MRSLTFLLLILPNLLPAQDYVAPKDSTRSTPKEKWSFKDRTYFGGNLGLSFGTVTSVQVEPWMGVFLDERKKLSAGVGITYWYYRDSRFTPELVMTIFHPKTALHDGGMILRKTRIEGAGCVFPISQREMADRSIGLRHRAAIGMTEESDAIAVVVSEETGHISIAVAGELEGDLTLEEFKDRLETLLLGDDHDEDDDDEAEGKKDGSKDN